MEETILSVLRSCPLFSDCSTLEIATVIKRCGAEVENFPAKNKIPTEKDGIGRLGILISGQVLVLSPDEKGAVLNRLTGGDLFGVSSFFGSSGAGTVLLTKQDSKILFIREDKAEPLWQSRVIRRNLIRFLTDRICFLNRKIAAFTEGSAKKTLCRYLLQNASESGICPVFSSYSVLAKELNLGRASLYRAFDELIEEGLIQKEKKEITILDRDTLRLYL